MNRKVNLLCYAPIILFGYGCNDTNDLTSTVRTKTKCCQFLTIKNKRPSQKNEANHQYYTHFHLKKRQRRAGNCKNPWSFFFLTAKKTVGKELFTWFPFSAVTVGACKEISFCANDKLRHFFKKPQKSWTFRGEKKAGIFRLFLAYSSPRLVCLRANTI